MNLGLGLGFARRPATGAAPPSLSEQVETMLAGTTGFALDPTDTATMWQDTARTTPVGTDSDPVGSIQTKWGTGSPEYLAQGTAAARPAWAGGSSLLFDGTDDFLFGSDASMAAMSQNANYVFAAARVKFTSLATDRPFIWLSANSGATIPRCWGRVTTAGRIDLLGRRNGADSTFTLSSATGLVTTGTSYTIMFGWNFNAGTGEIWLDGTSVASGTIGGTGPTENLPANQIRAGVSSGPTRWFSGNLGRQVFAPKEPTSDERTSVADWLEEIAI